MRTQLRAGFLLSLGVFNPAIAAYAPAPVMPALPDGRFGYEETVTVDGVSANDLYARTKVFIVDAYKSANAVIQMDDPDLHRLVVRGVERVVAIGPGDLHKFRMAGDVVEEFPPDRDEE